MTALGWTQSKAETSLSLKELVQFGLKNSPQLMEKQSLTTIQQLRVQNSWSQFWPSIDLSTSYGYSDSDPSLSDDKTNEQLTLSLSESLYNNGLNYLNYKKSKWEGEKSQIEYLKQRDQFCLEVLQAYFTLAESKELLKVQKTQHALLKKQFASMKSKYRGGEKT